MRARRTKFLYVCCLGVALAVGLVVFFQLDPVGFRTVVFQPVREVGYFVRETDALTDWQSIKRLHLPDAETVRIPAKGGYGVEIVADVYRPDSPEPGPAIVLLHGSYPWGRHAGLIRLLGTRLSGRGWLVIAPDARGFGDTQEPPVVDDPQSWRTAEDLSGVIDFVMAAKNVNPEMVYVLGHSMGANHALEGGLADPRVKALVLVGPGRYTQQEDVLMPLWVRARFSADRRLARPIPTEVGIFAYSLGNIRILTETDLARDDHKPLLILDGEKEGAETLSYLAGLVEKMAGPVEYHTLQGTGHYCGVRSFFGSATVFYQPRMFDPFFEYLVTFLDRQRLSLHQEASAQVAIETL